MSDSVPVATARADLAARLQVSPESVELLSHDEVTWPDGSLGCPRPVMMYPQVLVDGERLIFEVNGKRFNYHAGGGRDFFYCDNPGSIVGNTGVSNT
jgi:hypothetical protein